MTTVAGVDVVSKFADIARHVGELEPHTEIPLDAHFEKDLGIDSLDFIDLVMLAEKEFNMLFEEEELVNVKTVSAFVALIESKC